MRRKGKERCQNDRTNGLLPYYSGQTSTARLTRALSYSADETRIFSTNLGKKREGKNVKAAISVWNFAERSSFWLIDELEGAEPAAE